jgi:hypothetical protein
MLSALIAFAVLVTVVPAAYAEGTGPLTPIPGLGRLPNETLVHMHKKEGTWFTDQESLLTEASQLSGTFQKLIDAESKRGKNVSDLQAALATFNSELTACQQIHTLAGATIYSLVGWRADGGVKDRMAAGQSLLDGRASLKDANFRMTDAMFELRKSFALWRASHIHPILYRPITPTPSQ